MYKIKIFSIGKTKELWLQSAIEEYIKRLKPSIAIEWILAKNLSDLTDLLKKEKNYIALDPAGTMGSSEEFSKFIHTTLLQGGSRLALVIGGAEGLNEAIVKGATHRLSLSKLTFTHQMTRLILLEQLYRAVEIEKGSSYHK